MFLAQVTNSIPGGLGHELLTIIVRSAPILVSTLDPGSLVAKATSLRLSSPHVTDTSLLLPKHRIQKKPLEGRFCIRCLGAGSNRRPIALQASALPTELPKQMCHLFTKQVTAILPFFQVFSTFIHHLRQASGLSPADQVVRSVRR